MRIDLLELDKVHSAPNTHTTWEATTASVTTARRSNHKSICQLWQHIRRSSQRAEHSCKKDRSHHDLVT